MADRLDHHHLIQPPPPPPRPSLKAVQHMTSETTHPPTAAETAVALLQATRLLAAALPAISYSGWTLLHTICHHGPMTVGALAAAGHVQPPSTTRTVSNLEAEGLVVREPHPLDRRLVLVTPTPRGRLVEEGALPPHVIDALAAIDPTARTALTELVGQLRVDNVAEARSC